MSFARNSAFNLVGGLIPAAASLLTVPVIVHRLGEVQYGVFALVTSVVGYFALLDINMSAASVKYVSQYHARNEMQRVSQSITFGALLYLIIGLVGGAGIFGFASPLAHDVFKVPAELQETAATTLRWAAFAFLFGQLQAYLQSVPQALQRYDLSGKLEGAFGALVPLSTVVVVLAGGGLIEVMIVRLVLSVINCGVLAHMIVSLLPGFALAKPDRRTMVELGSFSAYSYLSRITTISYLNSDKLLIAGMVDMRSLAFYTVPFLLANRVFSIAYRIGQVIFPLASALAARGQLASLKSSYLNATRHITFLNACLFALLALLGPELLRYWAGAVFGHEAAMVLTLIALSVFINSMTNLPSLVNDGLGFPKYTGLFGFVRAVVGLVVSYLAIKSYGLLGAAWAQLIVSLVMDATFIVFMHSGRLPANLREIGAALIPSTFPVFVTVIACYASAGREVLPLHMFVLAGFLLVLALAGWGWFVVAREADRIFVATRIRRMLSAPR